MRIAEMLAVADRLSDNTKVIMMTAFRNNGGCYYLHPLYSCGQQVVKPEAVELDNEKLGYQVSTRIYLTHDGQRLAQLLIWGSRWADPVC